MEYAVEDVKAPADRFCPRYEVAKSSSIVISITDQHDSIIYHDVIDDLSVRLLTVPDMIALLQTMWNSLGPQWVLLACIRAVIQGNGGHTKF